MVLDRTPFNQSLGTAQRDAGAASEKMAASFKKVGSVISKAFSVAAVIKFGKESIESAAKVQASNAQLEQTFGSLQTQAESAMKKVADESGILKTRLQGVGTDIYAFAKTSGMDSAEALNMMQEALQVTADSAAYYDRSLEDTADSLKSFLKGNYANDAALGISCTETTRNAAANKLYGKSFKDLSEAQKQLTLLQMVKDANQLSGAMGQAARESNGWENVLGNLKESWNQLLAAVGKPILQGAVIVIQKITAAVQTLAEYAKVASDALSGLFGWTSAEAAPAAAVASDTQQTAQAIEDSADGQEELTKETKKTSEAVKNGLASFDRLNVISQNRSDGSDGADDGGSSSGGGKTTAAAEAAKAQTAVGKAADGMADSVKKAFANLYEKSGFKGFVDNVQKGINKVDWSAIGRNCQSIFTNLKPIAKTAFEQLQRVGKSAFGALGSAVGAYITISGKAVQTVSGGIARWLSQDKEKIMGFLETIGSNFSEGFDNMSRFFDGVGTVVGGSIDRMRPRMEESIAGLLSGLTDFAGGVGTVVSGAFKEASDALADWIENDGETIGAFFDNLQLIMADIFDTIGGIFSDIGNTLSEWWNGDGEGIFRNVCDAFTNIGTTFMNLWNNWIMPIWNFIVGLVQDAWNNCLQPVFERVVAFFGKVADCVATVWNNFLSPIVNWIIEVLGPVFTNVFNGIGAVFSTVFGIIGDVIGGIIDFFGGIIDFITGVFAGNWEKAWSGICGEFKGVWEVIWGIIKGVVNLIIDGINMLWRGIYTVVSGIVNAIGSVAGAIGSLFGQDWKFEMPAEPPLIPKITAEVPDGQGSTSFATGGIVSAPTLAVVGDNPGAGSGDPEVISPLSKLQGMLQTSDGQDVVILTQILDCLKRLYEQFIIYKNSGDRREFRRSPDFAALFDALAEQNEIYKDTHGGVSAFV